LSIIDPVEKKERKKRERNCSFLPLLVEYHTKLVEKALEVAVAARGFP
jgi:hypothetical protein